MNIVPFLYIIQEVLALNYCLKTFAMFDIIALFLKITKNYLLTFELMPNT